MLGLREHIERLYALDFKVTAAVFPLVRIFSEFAVDFGQGARQNTRVARHGGGVAGDHRHFFDARF